MAALPASSLRLARLALAPAALARLTGLAGEELALVTTGIVYRRKQLQIAEPVRVALLEQLHHADHRPHFAERAEAHKRLAAHDQSLDSASRRTRTAVASTAASHGGPGDRDRR